MRSQPKRLRQAARDVNVLDFIETLPNQFDEPVQERGNSLSTGQKQLINFARALAYNPHILILDEATSSVDTETELRIRGALERMVEGRTSVLIAHRLSTVQRADTILVMHKGQLREMGSHQQLLANRGLYWKLYQLQYQDQEQHILAPPSTRAFRRARDLTRKVARFLRTARKQLNLSCILRFQGPFIAAAPEPLFRFSGSQGLPAHRPSPRQCSASSSARRPS
jgi:ABC-type multidrug transport system ATPase subunit